MQVSFQIDRHHRAIAPSFPDTFFPFLAPFSAARFHFHKAGHERLSPSTRSNDDDDDIVCATGQNAGTALVFIVLMYNTVRHVGRLRQSLVLRLVESSRGQIAGSVTVWTDDTDRTRHEPSGRIGLLSR
jgi:hypothetical protein